MSFQLSGNNYNIVFVAVISVASKLHAHRWYLDIRFIYSKEILL